MNNDGTKINGKTSRAKFSVDHDSVSCNEYAQTNILFSSRKNLFAKNYNENFRDDQSDEITSQDLYQKSRKKYTVVTDFIARTDVTSLSPGKKLCTEEEIKYIHGKVSDAKRPPILGLNPNTISNKKHRWPSGSKNQI